MFGAKLHISVVVLLCSAGFIIGVGLAGFLLHESTLLFAVGVGACFMLAVGGFRPLGIIGLVLLSFVLGFWRLQLLPDYSVGVFDEWRQFEGVVVKEPELLKDGQRLILESESINGLVQAKLPLQPRFKFGDRLAIGCTVRRPEPFDGFKYDKYLERYHISTLCYYPSFELIGHEQSLVGRAFVLKQRLKLGLQQVLAGPEHTIILGALFGDKRAVPANIMDNFRATGTSHLLVISGLHVALLTSIIMNILKRLGMSRRMMICTVILLLGSYVIMTGVQPSATRASIFGSTMLAAELFGRRSSSLRILLLAAAGILAVNPLLLIYDAGFQLSFLATGGIIIFSGWIAEKSWFIPEALSLRSAFGTSLAAIFTTAPLIAYSFGNFSPVAVVANMVLVPMMPMVMLGGIIITIAAQVSQLAAVWLGLPLYFLIHLMLDLVNWLAALPYASITIQDFPAWLLWIMMGLVGTAALRVLVVISAR